MKDSSHTYGNPVGMLVPFCYYTDIASILFIKFNWKSEADGNNLDNSDSLESILLRPLSLVLAIPLHYRLRH